MSPQIPEYEVASLQPYIQPIRHRPTLPLELAMAPSSSAVLCLKATDGAEVEHGWTVLIFMLHILMLIEKKKTCYVLQSCPILCNPMDCRPPGSSVHEDSPGKNTGVGCHALLQGIFLTQGSNLVSYVSRGSLPLATPVKPNSRMIIRESLLFQLGQICMGDIFLGVWEIRVEM